MKTTEWTVMAAALGPLGVFPCAVAGQSASLHVSATVRAPQEQPLVHLAAPRVDGGNHAVIVEGTRRGMCGSSSVARSSSCLRGREAKDAWS